MSGRYRGRAGFGAYRGSRGGYNGHNEGYYNSSRGRGRGGFYGNSPRGNHYYYPYMRPYPTREESTGSQAIPLANGSPYINSKTKSEHPDDSHQYNDYRGTKNEYPSRDSRKMRGSDGYYYGNSSHSEYIDDSGGMYYDEGYYNGPETGPGQENILNTNDPPPIDRPLNGDSKLLRTNYEYPNYQGKYNNFHAQRPSQAHEEIPHGGYYRGGKGEYYEDYYANGYSNSRDSVENRTESDERTIHNEPPYSGTPNDHDKNTVPVGPAKILSLNKDNRIAENFKSSLGREKLEKEKEKEFKEKHWISRLHLENDIKSQMAKNFEELDKINNNLLDISTKKLELEMEVSKYNRLTRTEEEKCKFLDEKLETMNLSM